MTRVGVIVPCRNEAAVIERKLANLARIFWPRSDVAHCVLVVDDHSNDGTRAIAELAAARHFGSRSDVRVEVLANPNSPGKSAALRAALAQLAPRVDVVVLTDADVVVAENALTELVRALERSPDVGMVSGSQRFVDLLREDGAAQADGGGELVDVGGFYDRVTALVRGFESRAGRTFSVHGQWLAWRANLGLSPTEGLAADDIDLRLSVREARRRVELAGGALFFEVRAPAGAARDAQSLRRARAYVQCVRDERIRHRVARLDFVDRLQFAFYRTVPLAAPSLCWIALLAALAVILVTAPLGIVAVVLAALAALAWSSVGRRWFALLSVISRAVALERRETLPSSWQTARR